MPASRRLWLNKEIFYGTAAEQLITTGVRLYEQDICPQQPVCATMTLMTAHAAEPPTNLDKPEGRLDIIAAGYIERGQTDKQYDWVTQFEKRQAAR